MPLIGREPAHTTLTIAANAAVVSSTGISMSHFAGGTVKMPAALDAAVLGFKIKMPGDTEPRIWRYWDAQTSTKKLVAIGSSNASADTRPAVDEVYDFPPETYPGVGDVYLWTHDGSGNDVTQSAARSFLVASKG